MSSNPFQDVENAFASPAVNNQPPRTNQDVLEGYNPFAQDSMRAATGPVRGATNPPIMSTSTAEPPPAYQPSAAQTATTLPGQDELLRRQQELEKKEAELRRREQNLGQAGADGSRPNNWPPLPQWSPVGPCFFQDIDVEIPTQFQKVVRQVYYVWMVYVATLFLNFIGSLAYLIGDGSATQFGVSILILVLFTPCSFLFWYRPLYKAFRSDSSLNFMVFFFIMFAQVVFSVIQAIGFSNFGTCGWINTIGEFKSNVGAAIVMLIPTIGFSFCAAGMVISLMQVHRIYRGSGGAFSAAKAQEEFSRNVTTNRDFQSAAAGVATSAVQSQMGGGGNRY